MRNVKTKTEEKKKLEEAFALWKQTSKNGLDYLSGNDDKKNRFVAFYNTNKKNPKEPDIRVYNVDAEGNQGQEVADLWEAISKGEKRYLTGSTMDKEKLIAFYNEEANEKQPYIRAYYKED